MGDALGEHLERFDVGVGCVWSLAARRAAQLRMSRTGHEVIADYAGRLHQRVADS
jgi:hypothetical protein